MANLADTAPKAPAAFGSARLTPEEADRLASTIRPSWELDDAPFTGPGTLSAEELRALQGGGLHPAVRAAHDGAARSHATNGSHPLPPSAPSREPESSVILDPTLAAEILPPDPRPEPTARPGVTILGLPAAQQLVAAPDGPAPTTTSPSLLLQRPPTPQRPVAPPFQLLPPGPVRAKAKTLSPDDAYPQKPRTALWVSLGLGGVAVVALVAWIAASSGSSNGAPAPAATPTASGDNATMLPLAVPAAAIRPAVVLSTVAPAPTAEPPPSATAAAALLPPVEPTPVSALPRAAPVPARGVPAALPRANYGAPSPGLRPASRPKGGQTIVRDVPF